MQGGRCRPEKVLLTADGQTVAYDVEWATAMGREPIDGENYWEGTVTNQKNMPGTWRQCQQNTQLRNAAGDSRPLDVSRENS